MRKKRKRRTGSRILVLLLCGAVGYGTAWARKNGQSPAPFTVIAGTTFRPPGRALPGAVVRIRPDTREASGVRLQQTEAVTDSRGEFAVRVPAVPAGWTVHVHASGYQDQTKAVRVEGEQRFDLSFQLEPDESREKGKVR